jgi:LacI family transcriptional regulator
MPSARRVAIMLELDWPYERHVGVFAGTQRYARERGAAWDCVIDEFAHETLREGRGRRAYDGVIARATAELADVARRRRVPVVNTWFDSPAEALPCVSPDFAAVGRLAAEHLLGLGLRRFACVSIRENRAQALAVEAFHRELRAAGFDCACVGAPASFFTRALGRQRFRQTLAARIATWTPPTGVFVATPDMTSRYLATEVVKRGLRVPQDVALVAGLNEPMLCLHPAPSLTSVEVSYDEVGYRAAELLDAMMNGRRAAASVLIPPTGVAARQSTDFLAVGDELVSAALQFVAAQGHRPISVPAVARAVHATRRTLERRFAAALGRTVAAEIRRVRMERAKRHLLGTSLPVKAVARLAGFANAQRLCEAFAREVGMSPAAFRRVGYK